MEIERKFLLKDDSWKQEIISTNTITQGYICANPEHVVRIRILNNKAFLTVKGKNKGIVRQEIETPIDINTAYNLLDNFCSETIISKNRYIVKYDDHTWEIDEFLGRHLGLVVAEIELKRENEQFKLPSWAGKEVSNDPQYYNSNLAKSKRTENIIKNLNKQKTNLDKCHFLYDIYHADMNAFCKVVIPNKEKLLPIIYTPTIGDSVIQYSDYKIKAHRERGLIIRITDIDKIEELLLPYKDKIDIAVVTDGEGVLGIGDQGVGGINISIGKLMVYTVCGSINPERTLPVMLDVGTNNDKLLNSDTYKGLKQKRASRKQYDLFIDKFVKVFKKLFPEALLHWEDFGKDNASRILNKYRTFLPSFNDDVQGTGTVALAAILTGIEKSGIPIKQHRFCIFGAGTAGCGIANHICKAFATLEKTSIEEIAKRFYLIDKSGLLTDKTPTNDFQQIFVKSGKETKNWNVKSLDNITLEETIKNAKPTILIGCSTVSNAFTKEIIKAMKKNCKKPIIMPLSNPTRKAETTPEKIYEATDYEALVATGSPFPPVIIDNKEVKVSQCNNSLGFPGIGLAMISAKIPVLTDNMLLAASMAIKKEAQKEKSPYALLPTFENIEKLSVKIAKAIIKQAKKDNLINLSVFEAEKSIKNNLWHFLHK